MSLDYGLGTMTITTFKRKTLEHLRTVLLGMYSNSLLGVRGRGREGRRVRGGGLKLALWDQNPRRVVYRIHIKLSTSKGKTDRQLYNSLGYLYRNLKVNS